MAAKITPSQQLLVSQSADWLEQVEALEKCVSAFDSSTPAITLSSSFDLISRQVDKLAHEKFENATFRANIKKCQEKCATIGKKLEEIHDELARSLLVTVRDFVFSSSTLSSPQEANSKKIENFKMQIREIEKGTSSLEAFTFTSRALAIIRENEKRLIKLPDKDGKSASSSSSSSSSSSYVSFPRTSTASSYSSSSSRCSSSSDTNPASEEMDEEELYLACYEDPSLLSPTYSSRESGEEDNSETDPNFT